MKAQKKETILLVEDDELQRKTLAGFLRKLGYFVLQAESAVAAKEVARKASLELLLTDLRLGGTDGITLMQALQSSHPELQAIVITAFGTVDDAVRAMKAGAYDFIAKPIDLDHLEALVKKAMERVDLAKENRSLRAMVASSQSFGELIGESEAMLKVKELITKVAPSQASVLIRGESGTGKELVARALHSASPRRIKPFISVNCAALPEQLIEAELFGYEKGAFTGAAGLKKGRFERAGGGTLFIDEIGDIPTHIQVKLLTVLQTAQFERVGGTQTLQADVRIICATHQNLEELIQANRFREDLYYRINVVALELPPLRQRCGDIALLVRHFVKKYADLTGKQITAVDPRVMERLEQWHFPGNVRELENWIERAVVLADDAILTSVDFPGQLFDVPHLPSIGSLLPEDGLEAQLDAMEVRLIKKALKQSGYNQSAAARMLKISERAIRYKIKKHGLVFDNNVDGDRPK